VPPIRECYVNFVKENIGTGRYSVGLQGRPVTQFTYKVTAGHYRYRSSHAGNLRLPSILIDSSRTLFPIALPKDGGPDIASI